MKLLYLPADKKSILQTHIVCTTQVDKNWQNRTFFKWRWRLNHRVTDRYRRHWGALVGLSPPNWNMKHYKSVEFCQIWISSPLHKRKASLSPLSGDGSVTGTFTEHFATSYDSAKK